MANFRKWSRTASSNSSVAGGATTINWAEGQAPSTVNNSQREVMAQLRSIYIPSQWGWVEFSATASVASQTTFKITGDQTTDYVATRRVKLSSGSTTRYGTIVSSSFTAETTVTITVDSGSLSASHTLVAVSSITTDNVPLLGSYITSNSASIAIAAAIAPYITSNSASIALATKNASLTLYDEGASISSAGSTAITGVNFVGSNVSVSLSAGMATVTVGSSAANAWTLIETLNPSGVATIENTVSLTGYNLIRISWYGVTPATNNVNFNMQTSVDGSTFINWSAATSIGNWNTLGSQTVINTAAGFLTQTEVAASSTAANGGMNGEIILYNYNQAEHAYGLHRNTGLSNVAVGLSGSQGWVRSSVATARTHVRFLFSSGNIASGRIVIEGMA